jgi:hypothetical protein
MGEAGGGGGEEEEEDTFVVLMLMIGMRVTISPLKTKRICFI